MYRILSRHTRLFLISLLCLGTLLVAADYIRAASISACDAKCKSVSCGSGYKYKSNGPTYVGCSKEWWGDDCTGKCQKCTGSTVKYHCVHSEGDTCFSDTGMPSTSCGTTTYYPCTGSTYPNCSCDAENPETSEDACSLKQCVTS